MANRRIGGTIFVKVDGQQLQAKGSWTYNLGEAKKEMIVGADSVHGFKEMPQVPFIEGQITDSDQVDMAALRRTRDATVVLSLANGKVISLEEAVESSDGNVTTEEGEAEVRFEGFRATEIGA